MLQKLRCVSEYTRLSMTPGTGQHRAGGRQVGHVTLGELEPADVYRTRRLQVVPETIDS